MKGTWDFDQDPLAALRGGDPGPFEDFVRLETTTFLGFFRRLGAAPAEAEDLTQELFLKLFRHAETYQTQGRFAGFAFRVARNAWIDRSRRRAHRAGEAAGGAAPDDVSALDLASQSRHEEPGVGLARREEVARLHAALADLPERHRLVFELGVLQELPYGEISSLLHIPVGTVKSRMFHAVRKLRDALGSEDSPDLEGGVA